MGANTEEKVMSGLWRKWVLVGVAGCVVLAAGVGVAVRLIGEGTSAGYAVTTEADGMVKVRLYRLDRVEGLEERIRAAGIAAEVAHVPAGTYCRRTPPAVEQFERGAVAYETAKESETTPFVSSMILDPKRFGGMTLVLEIADGGKYAKTGVLGQRVRTGSYGPCEVVDPSK
ncbi:hypothetical protein GCM10009534_06010 [Kribbella sandramycini]